MTVSNTHEEYNKYAQQWETVRDCVEGSPAIKKRARGSNDIDSMYGQPGTKYLPPPNPSDTSTDNKNRYKDYVTRASFSNFVDATKQGLSGMIFRKEPNIELPNDMEYLRNNADGAGLSLNQFLQMGVGEVSETGRWGILTDYPQSEGNYTKAQIEQLNLRANLLSFSAENILNWETKAIGGVTVLSMLVLREYIMVQKDDDIFTKEKVPRYMHYFLDDSGNCIVQIYNKDEKKEGDEVALKDFNGKPIKKILFEFAGTDDNSPSVDKSCLYDIADVNLAHYRNSADFEESSYMVGQPTTVATGLDEHWVKEVLKGKIKMGSRGLLQLPINSNAFLLQANENSQPLIGMDKKELILLKLGARIIQDRKGSNQTAEGEKINFAGQNSKLATIVNNVENAVESSIENAKLFMGSVGDSAIELNRQFYEATLDPQLVTAMIMSLDRKIIAVSDLRSTYRRGGLLSADRKDEDIDAENEMSDPLA